ncbi:MAG: PAS domain-containing sensor histidine kinase [Sumerlaeia bacterium]
MNLKNDVGLETIPSFAVIFLNLIVMYYVFREKKTDYRFFLLFNAIVMIGYSASTYITLNLSGQDQFLLHACRIFTALCSLLMLTNLISFSLEFPRPLSNRVNRSLVRIGMLAVSIVASLGLFEPPVNVSRRADLVIYNNWEQIWSMEGPWPLLLGVCYLICLITILSVQYMTSSVHFQKNLARHLIYIVACPLIFVFLFSIFSTYVNYPLVPSIFFVSALISQLSTLIVVRQVETKRPLYLSRWIYFSITVLLGFVLASLVYNLYESLTTEVLMAPQIRSMILFTIIILVVTGSFSPVQAVFDRIMFSRAYEYRQLVREAQEELYATRARLRQAERLSVVGEMAAQIAHEIKNPLGPIKGYTQMMRSKLLESTHFPNRDIFLSQLEVIVEEVDNIDKKIHHLLDFSKRHDLKVEAQDINKVVERAATLLRLEAEALEEESARQGGQITIEENLDIDLPKVEFNRGRLEEVLSNLCRNALEARKDLNVEVILSTKAMKNDAGVEGVEISIKDNGVGISPRALRHLFEPFYTEKEGGTGLGLSIVRSHIQIHQGTIRFNLREQGGTYVSIWLPLKQPNSPNQADEMLNGANR